MDEKKKTELSGEELEQVTGGVRIRNDSFQGHNGGIDVSIAKTLEIRQKAIHASPTGLNEEGKHKTFSLQDSGDNLI